VTQGFDCHAHVFSRSLTFSEPRRYTPAYDATVEDFIALLDRCGLQGGLLTQPSFLGTDNSYMLAAVARHPLRLRAVAVVGPDVGDEELQRLQVAGTIGIRFNLAGIEAPDLRAGAWPRVLRATAERGWHVEIFAAAHRLPEMIAPVLDAGARVCIDHFGKPDEHDPLNDAAFRALLRHGSGGRVWVKLAAAYRCGGPVRGDQVAQAVVPALLDHFGARRLVWGSDWPHTQHESVITYEQSLAALTRLVPDSAVRATILRDAPAELFALTAIAEH